MGRGWARRQRSVRNFDLKVRRDFDEVGAMDGDGPLGRSGLSVGWSCLGPAALFSNSAMNHCKRRYRLDSWPRSAFNSGDAPSLKSVEARKRFETWIRSSAGVASMSNAIAVCPRLHPLPPDSSAT